MDVEWLILADGAQVVGGKLYLLGGGWSILSAASFPMQQRCALATALEVPWSETNQAHAVQIEVITEDGGSLATVDGRFEVGRPPGAPPGQPQRVQFAAELLLTFEHPGDFAVVARVNGHESRRVEFSVIPAQPSL